MQTVNATYNTIISGRYSVEYKLEIAGETYSQGDIYGTPQIAQALYDKFGVGNAVAGSLKVTILPKSVIPTMSLVEVYFRVKNASLTSDWYPKGKYYIDVRKLDHNGYLSLECYDAMLKTEYVFMESGTWVSTTADIVVGMIATDTGITVNADTTTTITNDPKDVPYIPTIGEDGTTARDMLRYIAATYGGNFIIDEEGELKLVQLVTPTDSVDMGVYASTLDEADAFEPIDRVSMYGLGEDEVFKSPESTYYTLTGRILKTTVPWTSQTLADDLLAIVVGYVYQPLEATNVPLPPHYQLGDGITINGVTSIIASEVIDLNAIHLTEISAPFEEEVNHEYPYRTAAQRVEAATLRNTANIRVNTDSIQAEVLRATSAEEDLNTNLRSTITQTAEDLTITLEGYADNAVEEHATEQAKYIKYSAAGLELGTEGSQTKAVLNDTKLGFIDPTGDEKAYIGQDQNDGIYKFFVVNGHIVNKLELGDHWDIVASGSESDYRLTIRWRN